MHGLPEEGEWGVEYESQMLSFFIEVQMSAKNIQV